MEIKSTKSLKIIEILGSKNISARYAYTIYLRVYRTIP